MSRSSRKGSRAADKSALKHASWRIGEAIEHYSRAVERGVFPEGSGARERALLRIRELAQAGSLLDMEVAQSDRERERERERERGAKARTGR
jgi:hypothetical protein